MERKNAWKHIMIVKRTITEFEFRLYRFLSECKTERECISETVKELRKKAILV